MRADFIGECMEFPGLPESVNSGMYLVPRMTREELRAAITGPVAVAGGEIEQRLVLRLLNDFGDDQDQLPVLQHALMRTWDHWVAHHKPGEKIDVANYEAVGTLRDALSQHAEEAYQETGADGRQQIAEKTFKALTDTYSDSRGIRRPTSIAELAAICEVPPQQVAEIIEVFRQAGRSFLTPPPPVPLEPGTIVDLSHESLMRCWSRLMAWADEEKESARNYIRISEAASWCSDCSGGLWIDPQLEIGLQWRSKNKPTAAWAERYDSSFSEAMSFLDHSEERREVERKKELRTKRAKQVAVYVLVSLLAIVGGLLYAVRKEERRAEENLRLAKEAVDQSLSSVGDIEAREASDSPAMEMFRKDLLEKAKGFYTAFTQKSPGSEELRLDVAHAHIRLGDIHRLLEQYPDAAQEYRQALVLLHGLLARHSADPGYQREVGYAHNWLGETLRLSLEGVSSVTQAQWAEAKKEYDEALVVQLQLQKQVPGNRDYQQELARTYYTRGILQRDAGQLGGAESDFRLAITLLETLTTRGVEQLPTELSASVDTRQELARAYNNLGVLVRKQGRFPEAQTLLERAVSIHEGLTRDKPDNREYKFELATLSENLAELLLDQHELALAEKYNHRAVDLIEELASPGRSLDMERIKEHITKGRILDMRHSREAELETARALELLDHRRSSEAHPEYHVMYGYLAYDYLAYADRSVKSGSLTDARVALDRVQKLLPELAEPDREKVAALERQLRKDLRDKKPKTQ
jgi:tetratricopeptide (TPR) repeat protein